MRSTVQETKQKLVDNEALERCARQFGIIGDPTKLKICYILKHHPDLPVSTIAELADTSVSNASHSLARLREADLVSPCREGQSICYSLTDSKLTKTLLELVE